MNADWYVDPLGRYEGRYFNGEEWTAQVKERGRLVVDPDWDQPQPTSTEEDVTADVELVTDREEPADGPGVDTSEFAVGSGMAAAVEPVLPAAPISAVTEAHATDYKSESPARQVAVLNLPAESPTRAVHSASEIDDDATDGSVETDASSSRRFGLYAIGLAIVIAGLLLVLLPRLGSVEVAESDPNAAETVGTEADQTVDTADAPTDETAGEHSDRDEDSAAVDGDESDTNAASTDNDAGPEDGGPEDGGPEDAESDAESDATDSDSDAQPDADSSASEDATAGDDATIPDSTQGVVPGTDKIMVGSLEVLNGVPVLRDLAVWHASSLTGRDLILGDMTGCWFGSIGEAVVQNAHCGPVATTPGAKPRFDLVPLRFENIETGVIQVRPITDAVVLDAVLPNGLVLVGPDGQVPIEAFSATSGSTIGSGDRGSRGERDDG